MILSFGVSDNDIATEVVMLRRDDQPGGGSGLGIASPFA